MTEIGLVHTSPDGLKKFWRGIVDSHGDVVLEYGGAGGYKDGQCVIQKHRFTKPTAELELEWRAQRKLSKGYVVDPASQRETVETVDSSMAEQRREMNQTLLAFGRAKSESAWFY